MFVSAPEAGMLSRPSYRSKSHCSEPSKVADSLNKRIADNPDMSELPSLADVVRDHMVSRGVAVRAFDVLKR